MLNNEIDNYISNRIDYTVGKLRRNNKDYCNKINEFYTLYNDLSKELNRTQKLKLDSLLDKYNYISSIEMDSVYLTAVQDVSKAKKQKNQ